MKPTREAPSARTPQRGVTSGPAKPVPRWPWDGVADQQLPFDLKAPNAETRAAMKESRAIMATRRARFKTADALIDDLEKNSPKSV